MNRFAHRDKRLVDLMATNNIVSACMHACEHDEQSAILAVVHLAEENDLLRKRLEALVAARSFEIVIPA